MKEQGNGSDEGWLVCEGRRSGSRDFREHRWRLVGQQHKKKVMCSVLRPSGRRALGEITRRSEGCRVNRLLRGEWISANTLDKGTIQRRD